jgi:hypothetical protein
MCGSTAAQDQLQGEQMQAYQQAQQLTAQQYAHEQAIFAPMATKFQSILDKGPGQKGFSDGELEDLNSQAVEGTAENYEHAAKALGENQAARGGGDISMPSGAEDEEREQLAASSANSESQQESGIKQADYQQGYENWRTAGANLMGIATGENPLGFENAATSSGSAAGTTADQIAQADNSWVNAAIGAAGAAAGGWAGGGFKH